MVGVTSIFAGLFEEKAKKVGWWKKYALPHIVISGVALTML